MVGGAVVGVNGDRAQARRQVLGDEDEIAAVGRLVFLALVDAERGRVRLAGMNSLPGVHEFRRAVDERLEKARAQRVLRWHVEVAADERAVGVRQRLVGAIALAPGYFPVSLAVQFSQPPDLRGAMAARVVLEGRGGTAERAKRGPGHYLERRARHC